MKRMGGGFEVRFEMWELGWELGRGSWVVRVLRLMRSSPCSLYMRCVGINYFMQRDILLASDNNHLLAYNPAITRAPASTYMIPGHLYHPNHANHTGLPSRGPTPALTAHVAIAGDGRGRRALAGTHPGSRPRISGAREEGEGRREGQVHRRVRGGGWGAAGGIGEGGCRGG